MIFEIQTSFLADPGVETDLDEAKIDGGKAPIISKLFGRFKWLTITIR